MKRREKLLYYLVGRAGVAGPMTRGAAEYQRLRTSAHTMSAPTVCTAGVLTAAQRQRAVAEYPPRG